MRKNKDKAHPPKYLSVGMLSERSGVPVSAIHFYERKGLIRSERDAANHRRFPRYTLRVLAVIRVGQSAGIRLEEIRERLGDATRGKALSREDWAAISDGWRADLEARIAALARIRDKLTGCVGCGCLSMDKCPAVNPGDRVAAQGPGAPGLDGRM
ncbi:redox-sensitive transcriptional activator SoxR [Pseudoruegeria sp. HB172150]|uniref:redox-sensitive transcriptional activator SoxR n=1 Tax=Pseudoruegeria sp. HB172150 TaxID=2721164 RepID=UPI0015525FC0|nr:redox-sensitive transcriptional activator SoxR [Pseudoruegeria sp. HB172150]